MLTNNIGQAGFHIPITPQLLFAILALLLASWVVFTVIIRYHWKKYGTGSASIFTMNFFYLTGSAILIALLLLTGLLYVASS